MGRASKEQEMEWARVTPSDLQNHTRLSESQFSYLLERIRPRIEKRDTTFRNALRPESKLHMTLRYLATGDSIGSLSALYRIPRSTFSSFFPVVCKAIYDALEEFIQMPSSEEEWKVVMQEFALRWQFPNACGAIDGKHVTIRCPPKSGSEFFNYKKSFSIISLAVVDARYNFLYIDVGTNGRVNDAGVFEKSSFNRALEEQVLDVPIEGVFVADDAFPLRSNILKPFSR
ncbi:protein ANTAGONIST OF LIKE HETEROCHROMATIN PROTEIN 1-like, partial [Galendromus occidentalis]